MTTREQARRRSGDEPSGVASRSAGPAEPQASLPERLLAAREAKGVDLYRAERDTKIRARYLGALERGDYRELPGAVYTKGFLRNYALYLGLDPDEILLQWRRERGEGALASEPTINVPRPLSAPRQGVTLSMGLLVAVAVAVVVALFIGYIAFQVLRFSRPPEVAVTDPPTAVSTVDDTLTSYTIRGTSLPGALVTITAAGKDVRATATSGGTWSADVDLRRGKNQFSVSATDPDTGKSVQTPVEIFITVPFLEVLAPTLTVDQPADGAAFENGAIPVQGTAVNAKSVTVSAALTSATIGGASPSASPGGSSNAPAPQTADIGTDGTFNIPLELTAGSWTVTVTAASPEGKTTAITRNVTVRYKGVNLVVSIKGGNAWMKVWVDGQLDPRVGAGKLFKDGKTMTFRGDQSVEVFTGSSGVSYFTLNGTTLGHLGRSGIPETWLFAPTGLPTQTVHR